MKHITSLAFIAVIGSTNAYALDLNECEQTAKAAEYVAVQRDEGTPELVVVFNARSRFNISNEMALHNLVQSVYAVPQIAPNAIYRNTLRSCKMLLTPQANGAI